MHKYMAMSISCEGDKWLVLIFIWVFIGKAVYLFKLFSVKLKYVIESFTKHKHLSFLLLNNNKLREMIITHWDDILVLRKGCNQRI